MDRLDQPLFDFFNLAQGPLANEVLINWMRLITQLGNGFVLVLVAAVVCILLAERQNYRRAILWFTATAGVFLLSAFFKQFFFAPRPDMMYQLVHASSPSFPSGHTLRSAFIYPGAVIALRSVYKFPAPIFMILGITLTAAIGVSRVMLGVHWPVDVFAGWGIGGGALIYWSTFNSSLQSPDSN